jgi:hypothetical protein
LISLPLSKGLVALIDDADFSMVGQFKWHLVTYKRNQYAQREIRRDGKRTTIHMHSQLMQSPPGVQVDHINGDGLDNRRDNLRFVSNQLNSFNMTKKREGCTSKYRGVFWDTRRCAWVARISKNGVSKHLGQFKSEAEAARAYDKAGLARDCVHFTPNFPDSK